MAWSLDSMVVARIEALQELRVDVWADGKWEVWVWMAIWGVPSAGMFLRGVLSILTVVGNVSKTTCRRSVILTPFFLAVFWSSATYWEYFGTTKHRLNH